MKYEDIVEGTFIERPNRFIAMVEIGGEVKKVHVKNTGRCRELLVPGAKVYLEDYGGRMGKRKLRYSLITVRKGNLLVNMDSQAPNKVAEEGLVSERIVLPGMGKPVIIKREQTFGGSRFDLFVEDEKGNRGYVEVKGVTLEEEGVAKFPDAPTLRGIKHLEELYRAWEEGFLAYVIFVVQMEGMKHFEPNDRTHKAFGDALRRVSERVAVLAYGCKVEKDCLEIHEEILVKGIFSRNKILTFE